MELSRIRPLAAVLSFAMCPEPAPIKPDNFIQRARRVPHCERKQGRSKFLVHRQRAQKDRWLVDDMAAPEVVDRHDQPRPFCACRGPRAASL